MNRKLGGGALAAIALAGAGALAPPIAAAAPGTATQVTSADACGALARLAFPDATQVSAQAVAAGAFPAPPRSSMMFAAPAMMPSGAANTAANPAFCQVTARLRPTADSDIRVEVWLPQSGWNGKFLAVGSFGWGGAITYPGMLDGVEHGYAVAETDTGHVAAQNFAGSGGEFVLGHPEKLIDYAWRADHLMTAYAKALVRARYGVGPSKSYWIGCSLGGLEGLIEAKRFPKDFDGIVAGAPPNPISSFNAAQIWPSWLIAQDPARAIPKAKLKVIHDAVVTACGGPVGARQDFVEEPDRCGFDPAALQCKGPDAPDCLTGPQVFLMRQIYQGPRDSRTGKIIFPGPAKGSELGLDVFTRAQPMAVAFDMFRDVAFADPKLTLADMDFGAKFEAAAARIDPLMAVGPDLAPFFAHGGRLLLYIGWNDFHNPVELADYMQRVRRDSGPKAAARTRLFAIPGMNHCLGGEGCDAFDKLDAIDRWSTTGTPPETLIATKYDFQGHAVRTRPICAWPMVARYKGAGDIAEAASFACVTAPTPAAATQ